MIKINIKKVFLGLLIVSMGLSSGTIPDIKPLYDKVYRSDKILNSYHFLLLDRNNKYYYVNTDKVEALNPDEIKSSNILEILNKKQSWGQAFASSGDYIFKDGELYTKIYFDKIKVMSQKKIKYLNKVFILQ